MKSFVSFLKYNNALPIAVTILMLGTASTYAATNPDKILSEEKMVVSIDNTYIANKNLDNYSPKIKILSVREDKDAYYVEYEFTTITLLDAVWQDVKTIEIMDVPKKTLGEHRDLGVFVTRQLSEHIDSELSRLRETQEIERQRITQKKVATTYSGLVGGFLDEKTETIDGYKPIIEEYIEEEEEEETFARPDPNNPNQSVPTEEEEDPVVNDTQPEEEGEDQVDTEDNGPTNKKPNIDILGDNPVRVATGTPYTDLGAVVTDDKDHNLNVTLLLDGVEVDDIQIDTDAARTYIITYTAVDSEGLIDTEERKVIVYAPEDNDSENEGGSGGGSSDVSTTTEETATSTDQTTSTSTDNGTEEGTGGTENNTGNGTEEATEGGGTETSVSDSAEESEDTNTEDSTEEVAEDEEQVTTEETESNTEESPETGSEEETTS